MKSSKRMEMIESIKGDKMIILEIMLIPLLALILIGIVFIVGAAGLVDSGYPSGNDLFVGIETEEAYPVFNIGCNDTTTALPVEDPAGFMFYPADNQ
jgi:hypothetical protein